MTALSSTARWAWVGVLASLAACGGGGDAPAPSVSPAPAGAVAASTCGLPDFVAVAMTRINQWRASGADCGVHGVKPATAPLRWNNTLTQAAEVHSLDMVAHNYFDHTGSDGSSPGTRLTAAGYAWSTWGENIAAGQSTVNEVVDGWIDSDGHCANLMNPAFTEVGLSCVSGSASTTYRTYWTMELAAPR
jgi:uncharacterized protein YkwD